MSEINLGQFIKNAFNYSIGKPVTQQPTKTSQENFQKAQQQVARLVNETMQNIQTNFVRQADILNTQNLLRQLNSFEQSAMMKDLYSFPRDMKDLMLLLVKEGANLSAANAKDLNALLSQTLDMSKLMILLQTSGKNAAEKLTKMITTLNQSGIYNTQQLKEMTALINACIPAADTQPAAMLKNLMVMYLPWLPLHEQGTFNLQVADESEKKGSDSENIVTITVNTSTYGMIRATIYLEGKKLDVEINCPENFPKNEFKETLAHEATGYDMESGISFTTRKSNDSSEKKETNVSITNSSKISPHLLLIIHMVINAIMALDKKAQLVVDREKKMDS